MRLVSGIAVRSATSSSWYEERLGGQVKIHPDGGSTQILLGVEPDGLSIENLSIDTECSLPAVRDSKHHFPSLVPRKKGKKQLGNRAFPSSKKGKAWEEQWSLT